MEPVTQVKLYTKTNCPLCEEAKTVLEHLQTEFPLSIQEIDIYKNDTLLEKYHLMIPVVEIDGVEVEYGVITEITIREFLEMNNK